MGGDEFIVFLPRGERDGRRGHRAAGLRPDRPQGVRPPRRGTGAVRVSAGVSLYPQNARDWQKLIHRADEAMYFAKRSGKGRVYTAALT